MCASYIASKIKHFSYIYFWDIFFIGKMRIIIPTHIISYWENLGSDDCEYFL